VPKDLTGNLEYRRELLRQCQGDREKQRELWIACSRDLLFYVNVMTWTYSPKEHPTSPILPMMTWPQFQDVTLMEINDSIETGRDSLIVKTRDMGATWMVLLVYEWRWRFKNLQTFKVLSMTEDEVDKSDDPDCLFWKLDFIIKNMPSWMNPAMTRNHLLLSNEDNGSTIVGDSTTGDAGRGGRKTSMFLDEFASVVEGQKILAATADVTNCRIFCSTPKGTGNAFYKRRQQILQNPDGRENVIPLHWTLHPEKSKGLYFDPDTQKPRSPWYDGEARRRSPQEVGQELDMDFLGSDYQYFNVAALDDMTKVYGRNPALVGDIEFDALTLEFKRFTKDNNGPLRLWMNLDVYGKPPADREYVLGADIATGTGATPSTLCGGDRKTSEKILEYANSRISPEKFALYAVAIARWLAGASGRGANFIWEANGPGRIFGQGVITAGYRNIYYRTDERRLNVKPTDFPGWWATPDTKLALLGEYRRALGEKLFINRSILALEECKAFIYSPQGGVNHSSAQNSSDPSASGENHGDHVIADALCWHQLREKVVVAPVPQVAVEGSIAWRRMKRRMTDAAGKSWKTYGLR